LIRWALYQAFDRSRYSTRAENYYQLRIAPALNNVICARDTNNR